MDILPPEILLQIFHWAVPDEGLSDHRPSWRNYDLSCHDPNDPWPLPSLEAVKTATALTATCKLFRKFAMEFSLRHLWLEDMKQLRYLRETLSNRDGTDRERIKRITLLMFKENVWDSEDTKVVVDIIDMAPKLEVFTNDVVTGGGRHCLGFS